MYFNKTITAFLLFCLVLSFTPEIVELEVAISQLEIISKTFSHKRQKQAMNTDDSLALDLPSYDLEAIQLIPGCHFQGRQLTSVHFQTNTELYFAVNFPQTNNTRIYNSECQLVSTLQQIHIRYVLTDRGNSQTGIIFFISQDRHLVQINQDNHFQNCIKIVKLKNDSNIVGGIIRTRGRQKVQIYITFQDGSIEIYDQLGKHKMKIYLEGHTSQVKLVSDHHPYPLFVTTSNWITMLDTSRYSQISQNCPFVPNIRAIFSQHFYGQTIYVISSNKIVVLNFQVSKKKCTIKMTYVLSLQLGQIKHVSFYSNTLFIDNKVYNMTQKKLYNNVECSGKSSLQFAMRRTIKDKQFCIKTCCQDQKCKIQFMSIFQPDSNKSIFIYLTVGFIIILLIFLSQQFIVFRLMKKKKHPLQMKQTYRPGPVSQAESETELKLVEMSKKNRDKAPKLKKK